MTTAPGGIADTGAHLYDLITATLDHREDGCETGCPYDGMLRALGDDAPVTVTGRHRAAELARAARARAVRRCRSAPGALSTTSCTDSAETPGQKRPGDPAFAPGPPGPRDQH